MKKILKNWLPVIIWASVIFLFSSNPDPYRYLPESWRSLVPIREVSDSSLAEWIGQLMHFLEYAVLAFLLSRALYFTFSSKLSNPSNPKGFLNIFGLKSLTAQQLLSVLLSMLYALSDETHQIFVPGRAFQVIDLVVDLGGILTGVWLWKKVLKRGT